MARQPLPPGTFGEIWTEQLGPKKWKARTRFRDQSGRIRFPERTSTSKTAAITRLKDDLQQLAPDEGGELSGSSRFAVAADMWIEGKTRLSSRTRRRYREVIELHLKPRMGDLLLRECSTPRLTRIIRAIGVDVGVPTAILARKILRQSFAFAAEQGAVPYSPADAVPVPDEDKREVRALTPDERELIRAGVRRWEQGLPAKPPEDADEEPKPDAKPRRGRPPMRDLADLVDVMFATGGRIGETLALRWSDVDLDEGRLLICGTLVWDEPTEEGGKRSLVRQTFRKGEGEDLDLLLPRFVIGTLLERKVRTQLANANDAIFPSAAGTWRDPGNVRKHWRKVRDELGLEWVTPHVLRKTVATILDQEHDSATAARQLGHSGDAVTKRHYIEKRAVTGPDAREALDRAFSNRGASASQSVG